MSRAPPGASSPAALRWRSASGPDRLLACLACFWKTSACARQPTLGGACRQVYNSAPTGGPIMLGGIGLTIAGVVLVAVPGPRRK